MKTIKSNNYRRIEFLDRVKSKLEDNGLVVFMDQDYELIIRERGFKHAFHGLSIALSYESKWYVKHLEDDEEIKDHEKNLIDKFEKIMKTEIIRVI